MEVCDDCDAEVEPVPRACVDVDNEVWFLVCPVCHYVFDKRDNIGMLPSEAPEEWQIDME